MDEETWGYQLIDSYKIPGKKYWQLIRIVMRTCSKMDCLLEIILTVSDKKLITVSYLR